MFSLGRVVATRSHLLADTIEIAIAFGEYEQISVTDTIGIILNAAKDETELLNLDEPDLDDNDVADDLGEPEISQKQQTKAENAFRQMEFRAASLKDFYPFIIDGEVVSLKRDLSEPNKLYLLLLACSRTRSFKGKKGAVQALADCFEEISAVCLRNMISPFGEVFMFGPNSDDRKNVFGSKLEEAIPALCDKMGMSIAPNWKPPKGSSGDAKIDIIGVYGFGDTANGIDVIIGQCASIEDEKNWQKKRQEADFETKRGTFHFIVKPTAALFIPVFYRSPDGNWIDEDMVSGVIAIDRYRILNTIFAGTDAGFSADKYFEKLGIAIAA